MNTFKNILFTLAIAFTLSACDFQEETPVPSIQSYCDTSPCKNGGTCRDSDESCACEAPYLGKTCQTHYQDILAGTWLTEDYSGEYAYHLSIEKNGSEFIVRNFSNRNGQFRAHFNQNTLTLEENQVMDFDCSDIARVSGTEGTIKEDEDGYVLEIKLNDYQKNCHGKFVGSASWTTIRFRKVSNSPCKIVWASEQCITSHTSLKNEFRGTWWMVSSESKTEASYHHIEIDIVNHGSQARIYNLFGNGKQITAYLSHNLLLFSSSDLPIAYTLSNGARFAIHDDYLIGKIDQDGSTIRLYGKSSTPNIPWLITEKLVYTKI